MQVTGVHRFLSRRDKKNPRHHSPTRDKNRRSSSQPLVPRPRRLDHFGGVFSIEDDPKAKKPDKEEERQIKGVLERVRSYGIETMVDSNARYALRITKGGNDGQAAFKLLMLLQDTYDGIVKPYQPDKALLGAVNREAVTCYLDALLFAMFARLDSFEAMLYDSFDDVPRKKLAGLLRLWVNMLRSGLLITTDITRHLQNTLSECGWHDAAKLKQQDPSEAFTFITGQLELPLLTLKMDLYHTGKEDPQDDHKFVNERLLEVAILDQPAEGSSVITLEDCLEHYFNNRIEVKRHLENQRRNTLKSSNIDIVDGPTNSEKDMDVQVEVAEIAPSVVGTPIVQTPIAETPVTPSQSKDPLDRIRPTTGRKRGDSIFSQRKVELVGIDADKLKDDPDAPSIDTKERKLSTRTEVLMPAWQFFKLLPWYTDHMPTSDAQVASHFAKKRPVLGICLKRYYYTNDGQAKRRDTYIDIPLEIGVPNFVSDEHMQDDGPLVGNFRLLLQSVVCHRGQSVNSGHYVCLSRGQASTTVPGSQSGSLRESMTGSDETEDPWMRFDDLAKERVTSVDIREALKHETPYLLFYQVQPIGDDGHSLHDLPTYAEATSEAPSGVLTPEEKPYINSNMGSENALEQIPSRPLSDSNKIASEATYRAPSSGRPSLDVNTALDGPRGRRSLQSDERRHSVTFDASSYAGSVSGGSLRTEPTGSVPSTPADETLGAEKGSGGFLGVMMPNSRRNSKANNTKSRPTSTGRDSANNSRFSLNMTKLTQKISRNDIAVTGTGTAGSASLPGVEDLQAPTTVTATITEPQRHDAAKVSMEDGVVVDDATPRHSTSLPMGHGNGSGSRESVHDAERDHGKVPSHSKSASGTLTKKEMKALKLEKRRKGGQEEKERDCTIM